MPTEHKMRTTRDGPVVVSERTLRAMVAIRRDKMLAALYGEVVVSQSTHDAMRDEISGDTPRPWLRVEADRPEQALPARVAGVGASDAAALRLALGIGASRVLIEEPAKERAKLSFFKCEGTVSILVHAHRMGHLSAVRPMVKALEKLGHGHVLPPPDQLDALWQALDAMQ